jgi:hypothetical protein
VGDASSVHVYVCTGLSLSQKPIAGASVAAGVMLGTVGRPYSSRAKPANGSALVEEAVGSRALK